MPKPALTRRSRRAVGALLVAALAAATLGAPPALAFGAGGGATLTAGPPAALIVSGTTQALPTVTLGLPDGLAADGDGWAAGDSVTLRLTTDAAGLAPLCASTATPAASAGFAKSPAVTATSGTTTVGQVTAAASSGAGCSAQDVVTITLGAAAPRDKSVTTIAVSGLVVDLGSGFTAGTTVHLSARASAGTPFGSSASASASGSVRVASIATTSVRASSVAGAANGRSAVPLGALTITDITGGQLTGTLRLAVSGGDAFTAPATLASSAGTVLGAPTETTFPTTTLTYTLTSGVPSGGVLLATGAAVTLASVARPHTVTVTTGSDSATAVGLPAVVAVTAEQRRTAGNDRYGTAAALFREQFADSGRAHAAVLTGGVGFADPLSAESLASVLGTGVLLTSPGRLAPDVSALLTTDAIDTVYVVGGPASVSEAVEKQIAGMHQLSSASAPLISVVRLAGQDRYETNAAVNATLVKTAHPTAVLATGSGFADALSVGPLAYDQGWPLLLTDSTSLLESTKRSIAALGVTHVVIVGGLGAVSASTEAALAGVGVTVDHRVAGADRTGTSAAVATWATVGLPASDAYKSLAPLPGWSGRGSTIWVSSGTGFADALAAGPVAGDRQQVILLTATPTTLGPGATGYLTGRAGQVRTLHGLGFAGALATSVLDAATAALA